MGVVVRRWLAMATYTLITNFLSLLLALLFHYRSDTDNWVLTMLVFALLVLTAGIFSHYATKVLVKMFCGSFQCQRCATIWPVTAWYRCPCGSIARRNAAIDHCPVCKRLAAFIVCPNCHTSERA